MKAKLNEFGLGKDFNGPNAESIIFSTPLNANGRGKFMHSFNNRSGDKMQLMYFFLASNYRYDNCNKYSLYIIFILNID